MIFYHGTNTRKAYKSILKNGFKVYTYFTQYLDSAIRYGGKYIFIVDLNIDKLDSTQWEYISSVRVSVSEILYVQKYSLRLKYINKNLILKQKTDTLKLEGKEICMYCEGRGEHRKRKYHYRYLKKPGGGSLHTRKDSMNVCTKCKGRGSYEMS